MYTIHKNQKYLLVEFEEDFNCNALRTIIHHDLFLRDHALINDIWLFGRHHALLKLGELQPIMDDFKRLHTGCSESKKTAFVTEQRLTKSIMQMLARGLPFECRVFSTLAEAEEWMGIADSMVA